MIQFSVTGWGCVPSLKLACGHTMAEVLETCFQRPSGRTGGFRAPNPMAGCCRPCWGSSFSLGCGVSFLVESNTLLSMVVQWLVAILVLPSIRVFSKESALHIRWPKYWSFSFSISPSNEHPGLISFRIDWFDLLAVQGTLKSLLQ